MKISYIVPDDILQNKCFERSNILLNRDGCLDHLFLLRQNLAENGIDLSTWDLNLPGKSDLILIENLFQPKTFKFLGELKKLMKPMVLIVSESLAVLKCNSDMKLLSLFDHIFTYDDNLQSLDLKSRISKFNYTFDFPQEITANNFNNNKFVCLIQSNKTSSHVHELYSERVRIIRWFEQFHPNDFYLYGHNWDRPEKAMAPWFKRKILYQGPWKRIFAKPFSSYKGLVESKREVYPKFKFSLCFENVADVPGYITEKIFDAMLSGNVPIYRGADNITDYIPPDCFIDYRKFDSLKQLHQFLKNFTFDDYLSFINAVNRFIKSEKSLPFHHDFFVDSVSKVLLALLNKDNHA